MMSGHMQAAKMDCSFNLTQQHTEKDRHSMEENKQLDEEYDVESILQHYDIGVVEKVSRIPSTYPVYMIENRDNKKYILKDKQSYQHLSLQMSIQKGLENQGIRMQKIVKTIEGDNYVQMDKIYCLTDYIEGEVYERREVIESSFLAKEFGRILGKLHMGLKNLQIGSEIQIQRVVEDVFFDTSCEGDQLATLNRARKIVKEGLKPMIHTLNMQVIHRDFHPGNVLFSGGQLSGIIDFDLTLKGYPCFDVAYFISGLLVEEYEKKDATKRWIDSVKSILIGYNEVNELQPEARVLIYEMMLAVQMTFVSYFQHTGECEYLDGTIKYIEYLMSIEDIIREVL